MLKKIKLLLNLWVFLACSYVAFGKEDLSIILAEFENTLLTASKEHQVPGFAVGIVHGDQVVYLKGFGVQNIASKQPITPYTVFQIGSISKPMAGTLVSMLHAHQILSLEDPVVQYLPHFTLEAGKLQLKHLITHTTGLPRQGFNQLIESKKRNRTDIVYQLNNTKTIGVPGSYFDYHNAGFSLLEDIVAVATQKDFADNLHERLLIPLGMTHTTCSYEDFQKTIDKAWPHVRNKQGKQIPAQAYTQGYYKVVAAGGINSCAADMCQFMIAQLGYRPEVVSQAALTFLHQPFIQADDFFVKYKGTSKRFTKSSYGLGWRVLEYEKHTFISHGGVLQGFVNELLLIPDREIGIVLLQNCESPFAWQMTMHFVDRILALPAKIEEVFITTSRPG